MKGYICKVQYKHVVCSVQCSICGIKCTCLDLGAFAGAGAVRNVHCAVCSALPAKIEDLAVEAGRV